MRGIFSGLLLAWTLVQSGPSLAVTTYPRCVSFLTRADPQSADDRVKLRRVRDEYAELARLCRRFAAKANHNQATFARAAGEGNLDKFKTQFSVWRRTRLAVAALPVLFQLPGVIKTLRLIETRSLADGLDYSDPGKSDQLSTINDDLAKMKISEAFFTRLAERAEALSRDAAAMMTE